MRINQLLHSPHGQLCATDAVHVNDLFTKIYLQGWLENTGCISVVANRNLVSKALTLRPESHSCGLYAPPLNGSGNDLVAYIVCDRDHRVEVFNHAFSKPVTYKLRAKRQVFGFVPVMRRNRKDGSLFSPMEMFEIGADGNDAHEVS